MRGVKESMNANQKKTACAALGTGLAAIMGGGAIAAPALADAATIESVESQGQGVVQVSDVQGEFSASQDAVTPTSAIRTVFRTATTALCASLPTYDDVVSGEWKVEVTGDVSQGYTATMQELAEEADQIYLMGCACSSNQPGGGAIANAEMEGVSIAAIAARAGL